jgi:hypothetical protein
VLSLGRRVRTQSASLACDRSVSPRAFLLISPYQLAEVNLPKRAHKGATLHALAAKQLIRELEVADVRSIRFVLPLLSATEALYNLTFILALLAHRI